MNYALMKDAKVMRRGKTGVEWHSLMNPGKDPPPLILWSTREGADDAARTQGAAVIPVNQVRT